MFSSNDMTQLTPEKNQFFNSLNINLDILISINLDIH